MKMTKLLTGAAAAALLTGAANAYDLIVGNVDAGALTGDGHEAAFNMADNANLAGGQAADFEFFIEQDLNGVFTTDDVLLTVTVANGVWDRNLVIGDFDFTCATSASISTGGAAGGTTVTLLVSGLDGCQNSANNGAFDAATDIGFELPIEFFNAASLTVSTNIVTDSGGTPVDGGTAANDPLVLINTVDAFAITILPQGVDEVADLQAANGVYLDFDPAGAKTIGTIAVTCNTSAYRTLGANLAASIQVDCNNDVNGVDVVLTGSTVGFDDGNGITIGGLNADIDSGTQASDDLFALIGPAGFGNQNIILTSDQDDEIQQSTYTLSATLDLNATYTNDETRGATSLDSVSREGTNVVAAWVPGSALAAQNGSSNVFRFANLSGADARVFVEVLTATDATFTPPTPALVQLMDLTAGEELVYTSEGLTTAIGDDWGRGDLRFTIETTQEQVTARRLVTDSNGSLTELGMGTAEDQLDP